MRHWLDAGYLKPEKMLLKPDVEAGESEQSWQPFREVFPTDDMAFLPDEDALRKLEAVTSGIGRAQNDSEGV